MKRTIAVGTALVIAVSGAAAQSGLRMEPLADPQKEARVVAMLKRDLKDPDSAQFRDLFVTQYGAVCGQVNAKNSYGGYTGFRPFVAGDEKAYIVPEMSSINSPGSVEQATYNLEAFQTFRAHCTDQASGPAPMPAPLPARDFAPTSTATPIGTPKRGPNDVQIAPGVTMSRQPPGPPTYQRR